MSEPGRWRWPAGADLRETLPFCILFALLFAVCYSSTAWVTGHYAVLPAWNLPFESRIPFVPGLSLVYLTITPALLLAPIVLPKRAQLAPFAVALCIETLIASIFFLLFPQTTAFVRPPVTGWARIPFTLADTINLDYNQFPSLHVAFACSAAWAYGARSGVAGRIGWTIWCLAVAMSTWLMWEHHLVDILGGMALSIVVMRFAHPRLLRPEFQQTAWVELCCLAQCARFSRRHFRYFVIFLAIYAPSLLHWRRYRAVRIGFCTAQWIDDLLDGDRPSAREPFDAIEELIGAMTRQSFSREPLSRLTGALFAELPPRARGEFIALARTMQRDRRRVLGGEVWSREELDAHHHATFALSVNLMLQTAGCHARAEQVPSLIEALTWCSVFRDLDDDLRKGLINIPRDVSSAARGTWAHQSCDRAAASIGARRGRNRARRRYSRASHPGNLSNLDRGVSPERSEGHTLGKERPLIRLRHLLPSHEGRRLTDHASRKIRSTGHASRRNQHWVAFSLLPFSPSQPHRDGEKGT